jgi:hypothetical protein
VSSRHLIEELQKKGLEPLKPTLERIAALTDSKGIANLMGELAAAAPEGGEERHEKRTPQCDLRAQLGKFSRDESGRPL